MIFDWLALLIFVFGDGQFEPGGSGEFGGGGFTAADPILVDDGG